MCVCVGVWLSPPFLGCKGDAEEFLNQKMSQKGDDKHWLHFIFRVQSRVEILCQVFWGGEVLLMDPEGSVVAGDCLTCMAKFVTR